MSEGKKTSARNSRAARRAEPARPEFSRSVSGAKGRRTANTGPAKKHNTRVNNQAAPAPGWLKRKLLRMALWVLLCLALGAGAGTGAKAGWSYLTHSPRFAIRELKIHSGPRVSEKEVRTLANLKEGDNLLGFRLADCVTALEIHPWVKRASVMRELPDRVVIEIKEREPMAVIALGPLYYVDQDGEIFKKLLPGEDLDYPALTGISLPEVVEDKAGVDPLIALALELIGLARHSRVLPSAEISEVYLDRATGATVVRTSDGMRIRFGLDQFPDKWIRLERTLSELGEEAAKVAELDLNYEGRATIRLREGYRVASAVESTGGN